MTEVDESKKPVSFDSLLNDLASLRVLNGQTIIKTKKLRDFTSKQLKQFDRKKKKNGNKGPSGFTKPTLISNELSTFLGKSPETHMARTEVTKALNQYIKEHKLQDANDKRIILPDNKLNKLLKCNDDQVTYFNLQRFLKPHFSTLSNPLSM